MTLIDKHHQCSHIPNSTFTVSSLNTHSHTKWHTHTHQYTHTILNTFTQVEPLQNIINLIGKYIPHNRTNNQARSYTELWKINTFKVHNCTHTHTHIFNFMDSRRFNNKLYIRTLTHTQERRRAYSNQIWRDFIFQS